MELSDFIEIKERVTKRPKKVTLDLLQLDDGLNQYEKMIVLKHEDSITIYDRICDHNAGTLITQGDRIVCPMHGWQLDPTTGEYLNVKVKKKPVYAGPVPADGNLEILLDDIERSLPIFSRVSDFSIRFLNHACLLIETDGIKFATDPWIFGPAFCTGWWLQVESPEDAINELNSCDFIYISHNHPDHLHRETLSAIRKDLPLVTPAFSSHSTAGYLRDIGFKNVHAIEIGNTLVNYESEIAFTVVKSGDFRDDSGLYFQIGSFTGLLTVDCKFIDSYRFSPGIDFQASSFAGGASGFPLCFENYSPAEQKRISARNRSAAKASNLKMLELSRPLYFMPYAGFFSEAAGRDKPIFDLNKKNTVENYTTHCESLNIQLLNVLKADIYYFEGNELVNSKRVECKKVGYEECVHIIEKFKSEYKYITTDQVISYFQNSKFFKNLDLEIIVSDDVFLPLERYSVKFFDNKICELTHDALDRRRNVNYLRIKIRNEVFNAVVLEGLPWEDVSIGFQCRVYREPNVYNSDFWYHFTNNYVSQRAGMRTSSCSQCKVLEQKF